MRTPAASSCSGCCRTAGRSLQSDHGRHPRRRPHRPPSAERDAGARRGRSRSPCSALAAIAIDGLLRRRATPEPTAADYLGELEAICADTAAQLDALPDPPDGITVTDFATQASSILTGEAEQFRDLDVPDRSRRRPPGADRQRRGPGRGVDRPGGGAVDAAAPSVERDHDHDRFAQPRAQRPRHRDGSAGCVRSAGMSDRRRHDVSSRHLVERARPLASGRL